VSISFEKFPDKTMLCGVGAVDGLVIKVMAIIKLCLISNVAVLCAACLGDKPIGLLPALMHVVVQ
jgi:hypothetical protein